MLERAADLPQPVVALLPGGRPGGRPAPAGAPTRRRCSRGTTRARPRARSSPRRARRSARWSTAALPIRTGREPAYPGSSSRVISGSRREPSTVYMICRSAGSPATARSSQSRQKRASSVAPGGDQRGQRQGGVAEPAVAVVPVALATEVLGQRGRRGGDDAAGLHVGEQVQGQQRASYDVLVGYAAQVAGRHPLDVLVRSSPRSCRGERRGCAGARGARWWRRSSPRPRRGRSRPRAGGRSAWATADRAGRACRGRRRR